MPTQKLREVFSELGSALLMSAKRWNRLRNSTGRLVSVECVSPADIEDKEERAMVVRSGEADSEDDIGFRDVTVRRYPLRFPRKNR